MNLLDQVPFILLGLAIGGALNMLTRKLARRKPLHMYERAIENSMRLRAIVCDLTYRMEDRRQALALLKQGEQVLRMDFTADLDLDFTRTP